MEGSEMIRLAPSGVSPWNHQVEINKGCLTLYWKHGKEEGIRTFTIEETSNLLNFLNLHRHDVDVGMYKHLMPDK